MVVMQISCTIWYGWYYFVAYVGYTHTHTSTLRHRIYILRNVYGSRWRVLWSNWLEYGPKTKTKIHQKNTRHAHTNLLNSISDAIEFYLRGCDLFILFSPVCPSLLLYSIRNNIVILHIRMCNLWTISQCFCFCLFAIFFILNSIRWWVFKSMNTLCSNKFPWRKRSHKQLKFRSSPITFFKFKGKSKYKLKYKNISRLFDEQTQIPLAKCCAISGQLVACTHESVHENTYLSVHRRESLPIRIEWNLK